MYNLNVKLQTTTPLFTGDAGGKCNEIKSQSIMGSLRSWFEIYCYAVGKCVSDYKQEELKNDIFIEKIRKNLNKKDISIIEAQKMALNELNITLPSQIFGCSGWKGFIKINKIIANGIFGNKLDLPRKYTINNIHSWFFPEYFWGNLEIEFKMYEDSIEKEILYPLFYFIEKHGFIGGKNNLGYGRVKFKLNGEELSKYNKFILSDNNTENIDNVIKNVNSFDGLLQEDLVKERKIGFYNIGSYTAGKTNNELLDIIENLITVKSKERLKYKYNDKNRTNKRHYIFGSTNLDEYNNIKGPNATKIMPWINKNKNNNYESGFISLLLLQNFNKKVE